MLCFSFVRGATISVITLLRNRRSLGKSDALITQLTLLHDRIQIEKELGIQLCVETENARPRLDEMTVRVKGKR